AASSSTSGAAGNNSSTRGTTTFTTVGTTSSSSSMRNSSSPVTNAFSQPRTPNTAGSAFASGRESKTTTPGGPAAPGSAGPSSAQVVVNDQAFNMPMKTSPNQAQTPNSSQGLAQQLQNANPNPPTTQPHHVTIVGVLQSPNRTVRLPPYVPVTLGFDSARG
ncbi:unnamed protein product, partial [Amoebophrya sp. A120]